MNSPLVEQIVNAVLYEGYILYPYRPSSNKNRRERFTFGRVYPQAYSQAQGGAEPCLMQTECLVEANGTAAPSLMVSVRFLHPMARDVGGFANSPDSVPDSGPTSTFSGGPGFQIFPELRVDGELYQSWHEAVEREIALPAITLAAKPDKSPTVTQTPFTIPGTRTTEPIRDKQARTVGLIVRRQEALTGLVEVLATRLGPTLFKVVVRILNQTPVPDSELTDSDAVLLRTLASTHTVLHVTGGAFASLTDPAPEHKQAVAECRNIGTWPVLVGDVQKQEKDTLLSSPIILYDYPRIAPESAGPLFDGTEIDELLTLRILTMTDEEKLEMRRVDEQARRLLERTEALPEHSLLRMHGAIRKADPTAPIEFDDFFGASTGLKGVSVGGVYLQPGDRVRIRPKGRADALDMMLAGQTAIIEAVEQDAERKIHLAVVLENDPGKDLGLLRQPGHRFFYGIEEVEPLREEAQ